MLRMGCLFKKLIPQNYVIQVRQKTAVRRGVRSLFGKYLSYTNTISSGFLMGIGDLFQQEHEYHQKIISQRYEWDRTGRMFIVGLLIGLPQHWFYTILDRRLPGNTLSVVAKKILLDQIICSPVCIVIFFTAMGFMEGKCGQDCRRELKEKILTVLLVDWIIWPPIQFINFYFLADKYRVLYVNGATMLYNVFLSYIKHVDYNHKSSND